MPFSLNDIPNLAGKVAVVTGATGGLGFETAQALAGKGANVIVAARNAKKGVDLRGAQQDPFALWALAQAQCGTGDTANGSKTLAAVLAFIVPDARFRGEVQKLQAGCK